MIDNPKIDLTYQESNINKERCKVRKYANICSKNGNVNVHSVLRVGFVVHALGMAIN